MNVGFGKHADKSVAILVLKHPDYVDWFLGKRDVYGRMQRVKNEIEWLIKIFDSKQILKSCSGEGCTRKAAYCSVHGNRVKEPVWWCGKCYISKIRGLSEGAHRICQYRESFNRFQITCGRRTFIRNFIKTIAQAKGLSKRVGEKQANEFFSESF